MFKNLQISLLSLRFVLIIVFMFPMNLLAADLTFGVIPNNASGNESAMVELRIDPGDIKFNVLEGLIKISSSIASDLSVKVETGGSVLSLWPERPEYSSSNQVIRFTGGTTEGHIQKGTVMRILLAENSTTTVTINWLGGKIYYTDGPGTYEQISARSLVLSLDHPFPSLSQDLFFDHIPPQFQFIELGQDPSVYENKFFLSFLATDNISGQINYVIREENEVSTTSDGVYILKGQDTSRKIYIRAYDTNGNWEEITFPIHTIMNRNVIINVLFLSLFIIFAYFFICRKTKNKEKS